MLVDVSTPGPHDHLADLVTGAEPSLWASGIVRGLVPKMLRPQLVAFLMERLLGDLKIIINDAHLLDACALEELVSFSRVHSAKLLLIIDSGLMGGRRAGDLVFALDGHSSIACYLMSDKTTAPPSTAEGYVELLSAWGCLTVGDETGEGPFIWRNPRATGTHPYWARVKMSKKPGGSARYLPRVDDKKYTVATLLDVVKAFDKSASRGRDEPMQWHVPTGTTGPDGEPVPDGPTLHELWHKEQASRMRD